MVYDLDDRGVGGCEVGVAVVARDDDVQNAVGLDFSLAGESEILLGRLRGDPDILLRWQINALGASDLVHLKVDLDVVKR